MQTRASWCAAVFLTLVAARLTAQPSPRFTVEDMLALRGEMMFYALRQLGKTAEFVSYANGDHSLSRHSRADAVDVNRRILEWFSRYLQPDAGSHTQ